LVEIIAIAKSIFHNERDNPPWLLLAFSMACNYFCLRRR